MAPDTPSGLSVGNAPDTGLDISWNSSNGATSYQVCRSANADGPWEMQVFDGDGTGFTDTRLSPATTYYYAVKATNSAGSSAFSMGVRGTTTTPAFAVSVNPTSVTITAGSTQQLTATVSPTGSSSQLVRWSTSDSAVATVSASGLIVAQAAGIATITVTTDIGGSESVTADCTVSVWQTLFAEGFEGDFPGSWDVGYATGYTPVPWGDNDYAYSLGYRSGFCADNANDNSHVYYNNMMSYMQRTVSFSGYSSALLSFNYWLNTEAGFDYFNVYVYSYTTSRWYRQLQVSGTDSSYWPSGSPKTLDLSSFAGQGRVKISFEFISDGSWVPSAPRGVWVDNIVLLAQ